MDSKDALVVFQGKRIRRLWHKDEWYFSVVDIIGAIAGSTTPKRYWSDLKTKLCGE